MSFRFASPWSVPAGLVIVAVVLAVVYYTHRSLRGAADRRSGLILFGIRAVAALLLVMLFLEPVLSRDRLKDDSLRVAVLLDCSRSMSVKDAPQDPARFGKARRFLGDRTAGLIPLLEGRGLRVDPYVFDTSLREAASGEFEDQRAPRGSLTDIAGAFGELRGKVVDTETVAVVLLSDGLDNAGGDAATAARDLRIPVHTVVFGSSGRKGKAPVDLKVTRVSAPEKTFTDNTVAAEAGIRASGFDFPGGVTVRVQAILEEGEKEIAAEWVEFKEEGVVQVPFRFVPEGIGPHTYRVRVPVRKDERDPENNSLQFSLEVVDRRASVLYFDATMRWEAKFLRDLLTRHPILDVTSVLHSGQGRLLVYGDDHGADLSRGLPRTKKGLDEFDVVILGDVSAEALPPRSLELLKEWVEGGGGLLTLGGYNAYGAGGYSGTPLEDILPVEIAPGDGQHESEVRLSLTSQGRRHQTLSGLSRFFSGRSPPTLKGMSIVRGTKKPLGEALITGLGEDGRRVGIVLAARQCVEGHVVSFMGDTSWLWYRSLEFGGEDGLYRRFWGQILQWFLEKEPEVEEAEGEPLVLEVRRFHRIGDRVSIRAEVRPQGDEKAPDLVLTAALMGPKGEQPLAFDSAPEESGVFRADFQAKDPGSYRVSVEVRGDVTAKAEANFIVQDTSVEMDNLGVDTALLKEIARNPEERFHDGSDPEEVVEAIWGSLGEDLVEHEEIKFGNSPLYFLVFVGLMTAEWFFRRRRNLL